MATNPAHWHLIVNHFPIVIPFIAVFILAMGFLYQSNTVKNVALAIFILGAISTFIASNTGEKAEHFLEHGHNISHKLVHEHEENTELLMFWSIGIGLFSILGLWMYKSGKVWVNNLYWIILIGALPLFYFGKNAGTSGGMITHTEIRDPGMPIDTTSERD